MPGSNPSPDIAFPLPSRISTESQCRAPHAALPNLVMSKRVKNDLSSITNVVFYVGYPIDHHDFLACQAVNALYSHWTNNERDI